MAEKYIRLYKLRKKRDQLERKFERLVDPEKARKTYKEIEELEAEIDGRLSHYK